ncbi:MAG: threonine--tRNA ligase [Firmicutes bacterium]|nr:threonine--tRNA ligase [Bacillota bacterium]MCL2771250.1 threonine--tRNA ligase [Bacillota bacterium]
MEYKDIEIKRHSLAHVMAAAVKKLYPGVKFGFGPAIDGGFYYDFDFGKEVVEMKDLEKIENEMRVIINKDASFLSLRVDGGTNEIMKKEFKGETYKLEVINDIIARKEKVTAYALADLKGDESLFDDVCVGPHVGSTKELKGMGFKLHAINGAYWKGDEKRPMLTRIYGYAFNTKEELKAHIEKVEEAKKRDHNKIGREQGYFTTNEHIGRGLPVLMPKGAKVVQILKRFVEDEEERRGYVLTQSPLFGKSDIYEISGHWQKYKEDMFIVDCGNEKKYALRPMTCPFQYPVFLAKAHSYRDLPLRMNESAILFRKEAAGELHGLTRMWQFTLSEGHIICADDQADHEFKEAVKLTQFMFKTLGLEDDVYFRLSKRDPENMKKYIGTDEEWKKNQARLRRILNEIGLPHYEAEGEAAFYGPKLDIQTKNVFGKEDTIITVQLDTVSGAKFGMEFTNKEGKKEVPVIIHRTSLGCYERTLASLIEKYAGDLPFWMMHKQVGIAVAVSTDETSNKKVIKFAEKLATDLREVGIRVDIDSTSERLGGKIQFYRQERIPYTVIVGEKEMESKTVNLKIRGGAQIEAVSIAKFKKVMIELNKEKRNELETKF